MQPAPPEQRESRCCVPLRSSLSEIWQSLYAVLICPSLVLRRKGLLCLILRGYRKQSGMFSLRRPTTHSADRSSTCLGSEITRSRVTVLSNECCWEKAVLFQARCHANVVAWLLRKPGATANCEHVCWEHGQVLTKLLNVVILPQKILQVCIQFPKYAFKNCYMKSTASLEEEGLRRYPQH